MRIPIPLSLDLNLDDTGESESVQTEASRGMCRRRHGIDSPLIYTSCEESPKGHGTLECHHSY